MANDISLTTGMRSNLLSLQNTVNLLNRTQNRLSSGKKVNSAIDNPVSFFASQALSNRASKIDSLKDAMGQAVQTITAADKGITAITAMIEQAKGIAQSAQSAAPGATSTVVLAHLSGGGDPQVFSAGTASIEVNGWQSVVIDVGSAVNTDTIVFGPAGNLQTFTKEAVYSAGDEEFSTADELVTLINDNAVLGAAGYSAAKNGGGDVVVSMVSGELYSTDFTPSDGDITVADQAGAADGSTILVGATTYTVGGNLTDVAILHTALESGPGGAYTVAEDAATHVLTVSKNGVTVDDTTFTINNAGTGITDSVAVAETTATHATVTTLGVPQVFTYGAGWAIGGDAAERTGHLVEAIEDAGIVESVSITNAATYSVSTTTSSEELVNLEDQYNDLLLQLTALAGDSGYKGINLLNGNTLTVTFEGNALDVVGFNASAGGLSIANAEWTTGGVIVTDIGLLDGALDTLTQKSSMMSGNLSIITVRQDFSTNMINTLTEGSDKLTLADTNQEGANMLMLQTRQSLSTTALSLSAQAAQSVLRLFQ